MSHNLNPSPVIDAQEYEWFRCPRCDYSLIGLLQNICPECGSPFDPEYLKLDPDHRRPGSPAYGKHGIWIVPFTVLTALSVLFRPISFARRLRADESIRPALATFATGSALYPFILYGFYPFIWNGNVSFPQHIEAYCRLALMGATVALMVGLLVACMALLMAFFSTCAGSSQRTLRIRFRFWCIVLMYSTILMPLWPLIGSDIRALSWSAYVTDWPFARVRIRDQAYYAFAFLCWWTSVIAITMWIRHRPRWSAMMFVPAAYLFVRYCVQIADMFIMRLCRCG